MSRLHDLFDHEGQSPWLDNIRRGWITSGELERWIARRARTHVESVDLSEGNSRFG